MIRLRRSKYLQPSEFKPKEVDRQKGYWLIPCAPSVAISSLERICAPGFMLYLVRCLASGVTRLYRTTNAVLCVQTSCAARMMAEYRVGTGHRFDHNVPADRVPSPSMSNVKFATQNLQMLERHIADQPNDEVAKRLVDPIVRAVTTVFGDLNAERENRPPFEDASLAHDARISHIVGGYAASAIQEMLFERSVADALHKGLMPLHMMIARGRLDRALNLHAVADSGGA